VPAVISTATVLTVLLKVALLPPLPGTVASSKRHGSS